ncbi:hypothetical protein [Streptomyces sp. NPDC001820]|uniref:hypothetical protein n=1 Tax=Streptomyces sp. NPDC001820 TaxID=3364613 RepID=UPI0036CECE53
MTRKSDSLEALEAFRSLRYPDYPRTEELRDWNSHLLTLDGHIAGYAIRVGEGTLDVREVQDLESLVLAVENLARSLEDIRPQSQEDTDLLKDYRHYMAALERLIHELASLAHREGGASTL